MRFKREIMSESELRSHGKLHIIRLVITFSFHLPGLNPPSLDGLL